MSRAFAKKEHVTLVSDTGDPKIQAQADILVKTLVMSGYDLATIAGVLFVAFQDVMLSILHMESPMPETNIKAMEGLIETLKENLAEHYDCHLHATEYRKAAEADEPPSDPEEPKVH